MRSNGLSLALATLLAPACVFAQEPVPEMPVPVETTPASPEIPTPEPLPEPALSPSPVNPPVMPCDETAVAPVAPAPEDQRAEPTPELPPPAPSTGQASDPAAASSDMGGEPPAADPAIACAPPADAFASPADPSTLPPTAEEQEFADLYGQGYNPVADPTLPTPVDLPGAYDPWEKYNRKMHRFNNAVDRRVAKPLARGYVKVVPRPVRLGVSNFFSNLGQPLTALNSLLQGKPKQAGQAMGRFLLNSTLGIGGIFDPAKDAKLPHRSEDFGQTLGVWGWKRSRYFELPLFGPRTVRDVFGMVGDAPLSPLRGVEADRIRVPLQGLQLVDLRSQLLSTDSLREGAEDDYVLVRDAWSQRRDYQIFGDRSDGNESLPEYLREGDDAPTVPVDAMPVIVPGSGT